MATHTIKMPDIGEGIAEVEIVEWHVKIGDTVMEDQVLADVMTDKASVEIPSPIAGTVVSLGGQVGDILAVGSELISLKPEESSPSSGSAAKPATKPQFDAELDSDPARKSERTSTADSTVTQTALQTQDTAESLDDAARTPHSGFDSSIDSGRSKDYEQGESPHTGAASDAKAGISAVSTQSEKDDKGYKDNKDVRAASVQADGSEHKVLASPSVRRRARQLDIDLFDLASAAGNSPVSHRDLDESLISRYSPDRSTSSREPADKQREPKDKPSASSAHAAATESVAERGDVQIKVVGLRRQIALKMQESKRQIPHFSYVEEIDVTDLEQLRQTLNSNRDPDQDRLTLLPFIVRAMVLAVQRYPEINARYDSENGMVTQFGAVHMGIATQTENGLMVPVLRDAQSLSLSECALQIKRLTGLTRRGDAQRDDLSGSTLTLSSLGSLGGIAATPIINHPEVAIVGVNRMVERPLFQNGMLVSRQLMNLSSSFDHRVIDGMNAAQFIQEVKRLLEAPALLLVRGWV